MKNFNYAGEPLNLDDEKIEPDEIDQSIGDSELSDALKGNTKTSLRLKINELERELNSLREGKNLDESADAQLLVLQHKLEDANRVKAKFETVTLIFIAIVLIILFMNTFINIYFFFVIHRTMLKFKKKNSY
jgi:hypothetical protein